MRQPRRVLIAASLGLACSLTLGCSRDELPLAEVTGRVTFNGLPARAELVFEPDGDNRRAGGRPSTAFTDANGQFRLHYSAGRSGAIHGQHRVLVKVLGTQSDREPRSYEEAATAVKTVTLTRQVRPGKNEYHFAVTY